MNVSGIEQMTVMTAMMAQQVQQLAEIQEMIAETTAKLAQVSMDPNLGQNINMVRAAELTKTGVELIGTACPYCLVMLDDGVKSLELEKTPKVADIIDIVADSLG